jgi:chorismate-pyruvate lyase
MRRLILFLLPVTVSFAQQTRGWPDTFVGRLEALAVLETLNAEVLASRSATLTLEAWCRDHRLASDGRIVAVAEKVAPRPATPEQRQRLEAAPADELRYRRVQLRCGDRVLSKAENWYVPARLSAEMNRLLDTTDTPFGKAVQPLEPYRRTFAVKLL